MDIKAKIEEIINKIKGDTALQEQFKKDPVKAVEGLLGVDLPDEQIKAVVDGVKAKLSLDDAGGAIGGAVDKLKGLFGK